MSTPSLPEKVVAIDRALAEVPHAFGGALALAYYRIFGNDSVHSTGVV